MNGTSYFYAHSNQWKYEKLRVEDILSPLADPAEWSGSMVDFNVRAERMGWLPSSPPLETTPPELCKAAEAAGTEAAAFSLEHMNSGAMLLCLAAPYTPQHFPPPPFVSRSH